MRFSYEDLHSSTDVSLCNRGEKTVCYRIPSSNQQIHGPLAFGQHSLVQISLSIAQYDHKTLCCPPCASIHDNCQLIVEYVPKDALVDSVFLFGIHPFRQCFPPNHFREKKPFFKPSQCQCSFNHFRYITIADNCSAAE